MKLTKVRKAEINSIRAKITRSKNRIAAERDYLRSTISEVEDICNDADDAVNELARVVESLSKYL